MKKFNVLLYCLLLLTTGCGDMSSPTKNIPGPYFLEQSDSDKWRLYYDMGNGDGHGRGEVDEIGWTDKHIFIKLNSEFYLIDKTKDEQFLNANEIVEGPFDETKFKSLLDSLNIRNLNLRKP